MCRAPMLRNSSYSNGAIMVLIFQNVVVCATVNVGEIKWLPFSSLMNNLLFGDLIAKFVNRFID